MNIKLWIIVVLINLILIPNAQSEVIDRVVASIGNDAITLYEIERDGEALFRNIIQTSMPQDVDSKLKSARKKILDKLIENLLLLRDAETLSIDIGDEEVNGAIEKIRKENSLTQEDLLIALEREGTSFESYKKKMRAQIIRAKVIDRKVRSSVTVSDEEINSYYKTNRYDLTNDDEIRARHILFAIPKGADSSFVDTVRIKAEKVLTMAKEGADFEGLAIKYSEGPSSKNGGDIGYFKRVDMVKEFSDEAFLLNKGEISDLVLSPFGFHIIKVVDRRKAAPTSFDETKEKIRRILYNRKFEAAITNYIQELKDEAEVNNLL